MIVKKLKRHYNTGLEWWEKKKFNELGRRYKYTQKILQITNTKLSKKSERSIKKIR